MQQYNAAVRFKTFFCLQVNCPFCGVEFHLKTRLQQHIKLMHTERGVKNWKCGYCAHASALRGNCRKHQKNEHKGMKEWIVDMRKEKPTVVNQQLETAFPQMKKLVYWHFEKGKKLKSNLHIAASEISFRFLSVSRKFVRICLYQSNCLALDGHNLAKCVACTFYLAWRRGMFTLLTVVELSVTNGPLVTVGMLLIGPWLSV